MILAKMASISKYTLIDHTADTGIELEAPTLQDLFTQAALAFCDLICDIDSVAATDSSHISVKAETPEQLFQKFLSELLFYFDSEYRLYSKIQIESFSEKELSALIAGEKVDKSRHEIKLGIKAVTYHQLKITKKGKTWKARVIFDV